MPPSDPLIDPATGDIDVDRLFYEARPIAELVAMVAGTALVPFAVAFFFFGNTGLGVLFAVVGQFVLAVGAGVVLLYVVSRGVRLADGSERGERRRPDVDQ